MASPLRFLGDTAPVVIGSGPFLAPRFSWNKYLGTQFKPGTVMDDSPEKRSKRIDGLPADRSDQARLLERLASVTGQQDTASPAQSPATPVEHVPKSTQQAPVPQSGTPNRGTINTLAICLLVGLVIACAWPYLPDQYRVGAVIIALLGAVLGFAGIRTVDRRIPTEYIDVEMPRGAAFRALRHHLLLSPSRSESWTVIEESENRSLRIAYHYVSQENAHISGEVQFQFSFEQIAEKHTRIRCAGEFMHACDEETAGEVLSAARRYLRSAKTLRYLSKDQ